MSKNDYHVLAYRLLAYLYACLKDGTQPDMEYLQYNTKDFPIGEDYWNYLLCSLLESGYIRGAEVVQMPRIPQPRVKVIAALQITPMGIEYLLENSMMKKAVGFLKSIKETVPGL